MTKLIVAFRNFVNAPKNLRFVNIKLHDARKTSFHKLDILFKIHSRLTEKQSEELFLTKYKEEQIA
jgi:hypothetical protein